MSWPIKQQVNFYTDEFRPPVMPAELKSLIGSLALTLMTLMVLTMLLLGGYVWQERVLHSSQQEHHHLQQMITAEMQRLPPMVIDQQLEQQLQAARQQLQNSQRVLTYLSREEQSVQPSFTALVAQLGQVETDGIWLSGFSLLDGGRNIELRGFAREARQLSPYIESLTAQPAFQGRAFRQVNVAENKQRLQFRLDTRAAEPDQPLALSGGQP